MYGPYWYQLNAGNLDRIRTTQRITSTEGRGGAAVRAFTGRYKRSARRRNDFAVIEFQALEPPRAGTGAGVAEWRIPEGDGLKIRIIKVHPAQPPKDLKFS